MMSHIKIANDNSPVLVDATNMIFVFGSNLLGFHGAGAPYFAYANKGALWGWGIGMTGNAYALPTQAKPGQTLALDSIKRRVNDFLQYASIHPELQFQVTCLDCEIGKLKHKDIAPMFMNATDNCWFDTVWAPYLDADHKYWGSYREIYEGTFNAS